MFSNKMDIASYLCNIYGAMYTLRGIEFTNKIKDRISSEHNIYTSNVELYFANKVVEFIAQDIPNDDIFIMIDLMMSGVPDNVIIEMAKNNSLPKRFTVDPSIEEVLPRIGIPCYGKEHNND